MRTVNVALTNKEGPGARGWEKLAHGHHIEDVRRTEACSRYDDGRAAKAPFGVSSGRARWKAAQIFESSALVVALVSWVEGVQVEFRRNGRDYEVV